MSKAKASSTRVNKSTSRTITEFERWLVPGLTTVCLYLATAMVTAIVYRGGLYETLVGNVLIGTLGVGTLAAVVWWLVETARCFINYIDKQTVAKKAQARRKSSKSSKKK